MSTRARRLSGVIAAAMAWPPSYPAASSPLGPFRINQTNLGVNWFFDTLGDRWDRQNSGTGPATPPHSVRAAFSMTTLDDRRQGDAVHDGLDGRSAERTSVRSTTGRIGTEHVDVTVVCRALRSTSRSSPMCPVKAWVSRPWSSSRSIPTGTTRSTTTAWRRWDGSCPLGHGIRRWLVGDPPVGTICPDCLLQGERLLTSRLRRRMPRSSGSG